MRAVGVLLHGAIWAALGLAFLLLGEADWQACIDTTPRVGDMAWTARIDALAALLLRDGAQLWLPFAFLLCAAVPGTIITALSPARPMARWQHATLALMAIAALTVLLPIAGQHDCDRKGSTVIFGLMILAPVCGLVFAILAGIGAGVMRRRR